MRICDQKALRNQSPRLGLTLASCEDAPSCTAENGSEGRGSLKLLRLQEARWGGGEGGDGEERSQGWGERGSSAAAREQPVRSSC